MHCKSLMHFCMCFRRYKPMLAMVPPWRMFRRFYISVSFTAQGTGGCECVIRRHHSYKSRRWQCIITYCVFLLDLQFKVDSAGPRGSYLKLGTSLSYVVKPNRKPNSSPEVFKISHCSEDCNAYVRLYNTLTGVQITYRGSNPEEARNDSQTCKMETLTTHRL